LTGHTGFKGTWLALMLEMQGHTVSGIALDPPSKSIFNQTKISPIFKHDLRIDIRERNKIKQAVQMVNPEVIIHLAAQPLVREAYQFPIETFEVNVLGTLSILEATRDLMNLKTALVITTDKVYKNYGHLRGYVETDELGGEDPYSSSKAAADIAAQSWFKSFAKVPMGVARAGNVIGGGDWAADRIIPDLVNAYSNHSLPHLRFPEAIRPWQHVLDCLNGYIKLVDYQISQNSTSEWNFGPPLGETYSVQELVSVFGNRWGLTGQKWSVENIQQPKEANYLLLNSNKARQKLCWSDKLNFDSSIQWTVDWYQQAFTENPLTLTRNQIRKFFEL
jgi:CDP-glucose 4,6-dehydratase